jgi:amino acid permease
LIGEEFATSAQPQKLHRQLKCQHVAMIFLTVSRKVSLGEMVAYLPIAGGHIRLAERFVNPALPFAMGWNYWCKSTIAGAFDYNLTLISVAGLHP